LTWEICIAGIAVSWIFHQDRNGVHFLPRHVGFAGVWLVGGLLAEFVYWTVSAAGDVFQLTRVRRPIDLALKLLFVFKSLCIVAGAGLMLAYLATHIFIFLYQ
jgi:hypothetical protein